MYLYKLRRKTDLMFSTGTTNPRWTSVGKVWSRKQDLKNHLNYFLKGRHFLDYADDLCALHGTKRDPNDYEVVLYYVATGQTRPVLEFLEPY
ncbi:MAG: hypothetical protein HC888_07435 [Candidatus Competibacteraceae bacterium]|nr:hypothetical protein [Candidatus Competibacteraceae bacterium]